MTTEEIIKQVQHRVFKKYPQAVILCGLPGSGKSTIADILKNHGFYIFSKDDIRYRLAKKDHGDLPESFLDPYLQSYSRFVGIILHAAVNAYFQKPNPYTSTIDKAVTSVAHQLQSMENISHSQHQHVIDCVADIVEDVYASDTHAGIAFDATHFTQKQRMQETNLVGDRLPITTVYLDMSVDDAISRANKRANTQLSTYDNKPVYGRLVPSDVIRGMEQNATLPVWESNAVIVTQTNRTKEYKEWFFSLHTEKFVEDTIRRFLNNDIDPVLSDIMRPFVRCKDYDQKNEHHNLPLHEHLIRAAAAVRDKSFPCFAAALFHDIGKPDTRVDTAVLKTDTDNLKEGQKLIVAEKYKEISRCRPLFSTDCYDIPNNALDFDPNSHYYCHENVSALHARRILIALGYEQATADHVYMLVRYHMYIPFGKALEPDTIKSLYQIFGYDDIRNLLYIRYGDLMAKDSPDHDQICNEMKTLHQSMSNLNTFFGLGRVRMFA